MLMLYWKKKLNFDLKPGSGEVGEGVGEGKSTIFPSC